MYYIPYSYLSKRGKLTNQYVEGWKIDVKKTLNGRLVIRIKPLDWICEAIKFVWV